MNVSLNQVMNRILRFTWDSIHPFSSYKVNASNCGICPNTTSSNSISCIIDIKHSIQFKCSLAVQSMTCDRIGLWSETLEVNITG